MRQLRMRTALSAAALVVGTCAVTAGCGQQHAGSASGGAHAGAAASTPRSATACVWPAGRVSRTHPLTLSDHDNGKSVCVRQGEGVFVFLHGSSIRWWSPIRSSSSALEPRANGQMMLALGVTGAYFVAAHRGTAALTSTRSICGPRVRPTGPTTSGGLHCGGTAMVYKVTVVVTR